MRWQIIVTVILIQFGCTQNTPPATTITISKIPKENVQTNESPIKKLDHFKLEPNSNKNYNTVKKSIEATRSKLSSNIENIDSVSKIFKKSLLNEIIPFWEGTKWSFEGHTSKPKIGEIACGYFVSTTLQDAGVKLNRYKLAQQSPINEAKSLAINLPIIEIFENSKIENIATINKKIPEGIHFIGFDQSHVGYILKEEKKLYLIHSNYIGGQGVEIEEIEKSEVFDSFDKFYIVEISTNKTLLKNWIAGKQLDIATD